MLFEPHARLLVAIHNLDFLVAIFLIKKRTCKDDATVKTRWAKVDLKLDKPKIKLVALVPFASMRSIKQDDRKDLIYDFAQKVNGNAVKAFPSTAFTKMGNCLHGVAINSVFQHLVGKKIVLAISGSIVDNVDLLKVQTNFIAKKVSMKDRVTSVKHPEAIFSMQKDVSVYEVRVGVVLNWITEREILLSIKVVTLRDGFIQEHYTERARAIDVFGFIITASLIITFRDDLSV